MTAAQPKKANWDFASLSWYGVLQRQSKQTSFALREAAVHRMGACGQWFPLGAGQMMGLHHTRCLCVHAHNESCN